MAADPPLLGFAPSPRWARSGQSARGEVRVHYGTPKPASEPLLASAARPEAGAPIRLDLTDTGIDLVAEESDGSGWCAIQCKCYAAGTRIGKPHLDSFISASARELFTARIFVDTGDSWGRGPSTG